MSEAFILNDRYRITAKLGDGGMAVVYKAIDQELGRQVAVKVLREGYAEDTSFLARFQREARAAAGLDHPNIVSIYDVGRDGHFYYLVMEYVEGQSLTALLGANGALPVEDAVDLVIQVCAGVGAAHRAGVVHCDLKPQNILVTRDGRVKVVDFGIAQALKAREAGQNEVVWATPQYAAPEQAQGLPVSPATDVYAIGVLLYRMLAGRLPFQGQTVQELISQHATQPPPPPSRWNSRIPPRLEQIVLRALSKEPSQRFRTATQMGQVLIEYRRTAGQATSTLPPAESVPPTPLPQAAPVEEPAQTTGPDWLAWFMAALVVMMVAGLVPVWMLVVQRYTLARTPPTPTPFVAPTPQPSATADALQAITVPQVVGLEQEAARQLLAATGLGFAVVGERHDAAIPPLHVAAQTIAAGQLVKRGEVVGVILSQGPRFISVPNVVGLPADSVEPGLREIGLEVARQEIWSAEAQGVVITQKPSAGTLVAEGTLVTLTVSTGARLPLNVNLGDQVMLVAAEMARIEVPAGDTLAVTFYWRALAQMGTPYRVFVHLTRADGSILMQQDAEPRNGSYPTTQWQVDEQVSDAYTFRIPADTPPGSYWIKAGLYAPQTAIRLPVVDPGTAQVENDSIVVREFRVTSGQ
ncbi:MAG: protein kinase domain-containing protein [Chloroflexota bacterium]